MRNRRPALRCEKLETRLTPGFTPVGPEFRVNTVTENTQWQPAVASDAAGNFVVAYAGFGGPGADADWGYYARLYYADGSPRGDPFRVAATPDFFSNEVDVAMDADGDFVVTWMYCPEITSPDPFAIYAQRFNAAGIAQGPSFLVPDSTPGNCLFPRVAMNAGGDFVIAWQDSSGAGPISAKRFSADGLVIGEQVQANSTYPADDSEPNVALAENGSFFVVWQSRPAVSAPITVKGRMFDSSGQPIGDHIQVAPGGLNPTVAASSAGGFMVGWGRGPYGGYFRRYSHDGNPVGGPQEVAPVAGYKFGEPHVAFQANGDQLMVWSRYDKTTGNTDVVGRCFGNADVPQGESFRINTFTTDVQNLSSVALDADGDAVIAWRSLNQDGSSWGVYAQRFAGDPPTVGRSFVNGGTEQRSTVNDLKLNFNRQTVFPANPADAFELIGPNGAAPVGVSFAGSSPAGTVATLTFPGGLADGLYSLRVRADQLHDTAGQPFDGNGDGVPGDDFVMSFHKLLGDFDGDRDVDGVDFRMFRAALNTPQTTFDLDNDGDVDGLDFLVFRSVYGTTI